jgi:hypothetical protein
MRWSAAGPRVLTNDYRRPRRPSLAARGGAVLAALILLVSCAGPFGDDDDTDDAAVAQATATMAIPPTPTATATPQPTATPTATPSPTPFIPPTVAVREDDSVEGCLRRNITPELLISLSLDQTELTEDIFRTCLGQSIPSELVFLLNPIIEDAGDCTLDVSRTLTNEQLITLAGPDGAAKDQIVDDVIDDILGCVTDQYGLDFL